MKRSQQKSRATAKTFGRPGTSSTAAYRTQRARFQSLSWRTRITLLVAAIVAGIISAAAANMDLLLGAAIAAGLLLALSAVFVAPQSLYIVAVLGMYAPIAVGAGMLLESQALNGFVGDPAGAAANLFVAALFATWASVRFSRGKPWVTLALALLSTFTVAMALVYVFPPLGLTAAYISMASVLALRCGGWAWISGVFGLAIDEIRGAAPKPKDSATDTLDDRATKSAMLLRAKAEQRTASVLESMDSSHSVFHDVRLRKAATSLPHLVIGPAGVFVVASISTRGPITENARDGVNVGGVNLGEVAASLIQHQLLVAKMLKMRSKDIAAVIVVHPDKEGAVAEGTRRTLAIFDAYSGELPTAQVVLVSADMLDVEINPGLATWGAISRKNAVRRARMFALPAISALNNNEVQETVRISSVDIDGYTTAPEPMIPQVSWLEIGSQVVMETSEGILTDLRVAGDAYRDVDGTIVVPLCAEEEWAEGESTGHHPRSFPIPLDIVKPAEQ